MTSFVRFIFLLVVCGALVNLAIVLMANTHSQRRQAADSVVEQQRFHDLIVRLNERGRMQRADIAVEWQKTRPGDEVLETSLLVRQYVLGEKGESQPLPLVRIAIPGDKLSVDGLMLDCKFTLAEDREQFKPLEGATLYYFVHMYGEGQPEATRYAFLRYPEVPQLTRIHPAAPHPSYYEIQLWQGLWDLIPDPPKSLPGGGGSSAPPEDPRRERAGRRGLNVMWLAPATRSVRVNKTYTAFVGADGVNIVEDHTPGLLNNVLEEAANSREGRDGVLIPLAPRQALPQ